MQNRFAIVDVERIPLVGESTMFKNEATWNFFSSDVVFAILSAKRADRLLISKQMKDYQNRQECGFKVAITSAVIILNGRAGLRGRVTPWCSSFLRRCSLHCLCNEEERHSFHISCVTEAPLCGIIPLSLLRILEVDYKVSWFKVWEFVHLGSCDLQGCRPRWDEAGYIGVHVDTDMMGQMALFCIVCFPWYCRGKTKSGLTERRGRF